MSNAKAIMSDKVTSMSSALDIQEAVEIFIAKKFTTVPVVNGSGDLAGQLTESILIRLYILSKGQPAKFKKLAHCLEHLEKPQFVSPDDSIASVLKAIMLSPSKRVFVSKDNNKIMGIVSPKDVLKALAQNDKTADQIKDAMAQSLQPNT